MKQQDGRNLNAMILNFFLAIWPSGEGPLAGGGAGGKGGGRGGVDVKEEGEGKRQQKARRGGAEEGWRGD